MRSAMKAVLRVVEESPSSDARRDLVATILDTLARVPARDNYYFRATLVEHLGSLCVDAASAAVVLPAIYRALTDHDQGVRGAAAGAYAGLVRAVGAEHLPTLVHETFLVLLADAFVVVHSAALRALDDVRLPEQHLREALDRVSTLVAVYADGERPDILEVALRVWLTLLRRAGRSTPNMQAVAVRLIGKLPPYSADRFIEYNHMGLRGVAGYGELVLALLANPKTFDTAHEKLLDELGALDHADVRRLADAVVETAQLLLAAYPWHLERLLQILADAGAWDAARRLAADAVAACGETRDRRPRKLRAQLAEALVAVEAGAAAAAPDAVIAAARAARDVSATLAADDTAHRDARDPTRIFGSASLLD